MRQLLPLSFALLLAACGDGQPLTPPDARLPDGAVYHGQVVAGLLQGEGRLDYPDGSVFRGSFKDGLLEGPGEWRGAAGERYAGDFHRGAFQGPGTLHYADGSTYDGHFEQGRMSGEGSLTLLGGGRYRGQFKDDRYHGLGRLETADGGSFQGRFAKGEPAGEGVRVDAEGNQSSGRFTRGGLNGEGTYVGRDGDRYSGEFKDDQFHGKGRYEDGQGAVWSGRFVQGELTEGDYRGSDGSAYHGAFRQFRFHGKGRLQQPDGSVYEGRFAYGRYDGEGRLRLADGRLEDGHWRRGTRVRDASGDAVPDPLEVGLLEQGRLLDEALAALPVSTPAKELYALTLGGDGQQRVFMREADYVATLLGERFGARGRITLVNQRDHLADRPMATRESLARAVRALAERSGPEDLVFLYFTSHGSAQHELSLRQPGLALGDLPAWQLAQVLAPLKERYKVVVISACYSGGFLPALKDDKTLVMTASRADRVSFGCSDENDFTYFGRALFAEALNQTDDLEQAFALAKATVAEREKAQGFAPSEPQLWAPLAVLGQWRALRAQQAARASAAHAQDGAVQASTTP
ncbi:C13 family peptidase [Pseudomonas mangiferae]|uniref:Peptidase C13 n=1 Tax=Pseudomonas mangiferae TaxID=2593654 RepID=A0A553GUF0_9PSED|nr:C13 family peptidase [Pseudomonas mangiferae]TRX73124.1 peptidase C13 [Pseudomonas mangiferae]